MKSSRHDMTYSRQDNSAVRREKSSVMSSHDLVFRELLPMVKANLTPRTVFEKSFSACSWESISTTVIRTDDISFCFGGILPEDLLTALT